MKHYADAQRLRQRANEALRENLKRANEVAHGGARDYAEAYGRLRAAVEIYIATMEELDEISPSIEELQELERKD